MMTASDTSVTTTSERGQRGVNRVLSKLDASIEAGNYYEAHQMYRTLYFRYTGQRKYDECLELLYNGGLKLSLKQQEASAADLGLLLLDTLEKVPSIKDHKLWIERLGNIICQLTASCIERETLIHRAIKWSVKVSGFIPGDPSLYKRIADVFWKENNTELARRYYLHCRDGDLCGRILVKINETKGLACEADLFIAQAVFKQMSLQDLKTAEKTFSAYTRYHPKIHRKSAPYKQPLLNYLHFLFITISNMDLAAYRSLRDLYMQELERDAGFSKYLVKFESMYFGVSPPPVSTENRFGGLFGDVISRLLNDIEDVEDDDNESNGNNARGGRGQDAAQALD